MKRDATPRLLLTGASGVLGSALLEEMDDIAVTCLVHRTPTRRDCVERVRGDISRPRLGLDRDEYKRLVGTTDVIVHAAATTDFTAGDAATYEMNVTGTANVLELAEAASADLYYVSTAFVQRASRVRDGGETCGGPGAYLASKQAAEDLVRSSGLPAAIVRPSVIIGDSESGQMATFQGLHALAGAFVKGRLPLVPLTPNAVVDFVPQDYVAAAIAALVRTRECRGELWLTAGDRALRASDLVDLSLEFAAELGREVHPPRFIAPEAIDRLIRPVFIDPLPEQARKRFDQMLNMTALFGADAAFPSSAGELERRFGVALPDDLRAAFVRSLEHWAIRKGLRRPVGSAEAAATP